MPLGKDLKDANQDVKDSTKFVHFMMFEDEKVQKKHQTAPYTKKFVAVLYPNCIQEPIFTTFKSITSTKG